MEKAKTILLILLVGGSLLQSYLLAYHSTDYESILEADYIETETIGTQENQKNLVFPMHIVLHSESGQHAVLYPGHYFYHLILEELQNLSFGDPELSDQTGFAVNQMRGEQLGLELRFPGGLPIQLANMVLQMNTDALPAEDTIRTVWITVHPETDEPEVYLAGDNFSDVYIVSSANLDKMTVERLVRFGDYQQPKYAVNTFGFLYPEEAIQIPRIVHTFTSITNDQVENMLFPDPAITRNFPTSDGTDIYSDGKRVLEVDRSQLWMKFSDPMSAIHEEAASSQSLNAIVQFINRHGGWNGQFALEQIMTRQEPGGPRFVFRQFMPALPNWYPILDSTKSRYGAIEAMLQQGTVTEYERSLIMIDPERTTGVDVHLPGGDVLLQRLERMGITTRIEAVTPAYKPRIAPESIEFVPVWAIVHKDGSLIEVPDL